MLLVAFVVLCIILIKLGSGRHYDYIQYVMPLNRVKVTETLDFAAHIIYTTALFTCRFSGLLFYHRLCAQSRRFVITIRCAAALLFLAYIPQLILLILHCLPVTSLWPYAWQPGVDDYTCLAWGVVYVTNSGISLVCDMLLFGIPLAIIRFVKLSRKRKIGLALIFFPGLLYVEPSPSIDSSLTTIVSSASRLLVLFLWSKDNGIPMSPGPTTLCLPSKRPRLGVH